MKRTLVLTLVLVMALASTAFAGVNMNGEFYYELSQKATGDNSLKWFEGEFGLTRNMFLELKPSASGDGWSFNGRLRTVKVETGDWEWGPNNGPIGIAWESYKLKVDNPYFNLTMFRRDWEPNWNDPVSFLATGDWPHNEDRMRVTVPVGDLAELRLDYDYQGKRVYAFADFDLAGFDTGLVVHRPFGGDDSFVGHTTIKYNDLTISPVVGITNTEEGKDNLGFGVRVQGPIAGDLSANTRIMERQANFVGGRYRGVDSTIDYTPNWQAWVNYNQTGSDLGVKTTEAYVSYRANTVVGHNDLFDKRGNIHVLDPIDATNVGSNAFRFHGDNWHKAKDFFARLQVKNIQGAKDGDGNVKPDETYVFAGVSAPIMRDDLLARAQVLAVMVADANVDNIYRSQLGVRYQATDKLVVEPIVRYYTDTEEFRIQNTTEYKVGNVTLGFDLGQTMKESAKTQQDAKIRVKVTF